MFRRPNKLLVLSFLTACAVIVPSVFLCGCGSNNAANDKAAMSHYKAGLDFNDGKKYSDAVVAFGKAVELKPDYAEAYFGMGMAHGELKEYVQAIRAYNQFVALEPSGMRSLIANTQVVRFHRILAKEKAKDK